MPIADLFSSLGRSLPVPAARNPVETRRDGRDSQAGQGPALSRPEDAAVGTVGPTGPLAYAGPACPDRGRDRSGPENTNLTKAVPTVPTVPTPADGWRDADLEPVGLVLDELGDPAVSCG